MRSFDFRAYLTMAALYHSGMFGGKQLGGSNLYRLLKKAHLLHCAQSPRVNVLPMYASARRIFARLASGSF
jgi:hypothetical protein